MSRRYLPVKAAALAAAGFLLTGGGVAFAAPDSDNGKSNGNGNASAAASGSSSGKSGSAPGKSSSAPGNSASAPGKSSGPGRSETTPGGNSAGASNSGPKTLPGAAAAVAAALTGKVNSASTGTPNSFGKAVAAAASSRLGKGSGQSVDVETPSATAIPTFTASVTVTIPIPTSVPIPIALPVTIPNSIPLTFTFTATPKASAGDSELAPAPSRDDLNSTIPTIPRPEPSVAVAPGISGPQQSAAAPPPAAIPATAAAVSISPPRSTGTTAGPSSAGGTESSWIGRVTSQVVDEVRAVLREVTLQELALAALPGLVGMLFFFTTGIGIGHRQAKFGFALESTGALRFAMRGPLGVVRPGGFIALPSRGSKPRSTVLGRSSAAALDRAA